MKFSKYNGGIDMNIVLTGGTGLVGKHIIDKLNDHQIYVLTRQDREDSNRVKYINWEKENYEQYMPKDVDVVINLAGATLQNRWTDKYKETILKSRIETTNKLYEYFKHHNAPKVLFNASAVGYYPPSKTLTYDETDIFMPHDFLSKVVYQWENAAHQFTELGTRVIIGRFGVILDAFGGAFPVMKQPYEYFAGGNLGDGQQWMSWIHIDDLVNAILTLIASSDSGIFNLTSPNPVTQEQLGKAIAHAINRPHYLPAPKFAMKLILGEQSDMVLNTQKVLPNRLEAIGFAFNYPDIALAIRSLTKQ